MPGAGLCPCTPDPTGKTTSWLEYLIWRMKERVGEWTKKHPSRLVVGCHVCSFAQDPLLGADIPDLSVGMSVGSVQKYNFSTTPPNILAKKFILRLSERISGFQGGIYPPTSKNAFYGHFWAKFAIYTNLSRERVLHTLWIMDRAMTGQSQTSSSESPT